MHQRWHGGAKLLDARFSSQYGTLPVQVVLHCMFSQQRGPRCALELARRLETTDLSPSPQVYVLRGGFTGFVRHYKNETDLVEGFDSKYHD